MNISEDMHIAIEILAIKLSTAFFSKDEFNKLMKERELVYSGDKNAIQRVISIYGKEIKSSETSKK